MNNLKPLSDHSTEDIKNTIKWMKENQQPSKFCLNYMVFSDLIKDFESELDKRLNKS